MICAKIARVIAVKNTIMKIAGTGIALDFGLHMSI